VIALHFGDAHRPLFGVYHPALRAAASTRAVVMCHAFGAEYMVSHHLLRRAAIALAEAGHDVLRFDYYGSGDSAGDPEDVSLARWCRDVETAADEVMGLCGAERVTLFGARLGAAVALRVAARNPQRVDRIVAWDPVLRGDGYLAWLLWAERSLHPGGTSEPQVLGHALSAELRDELHSLDETEAAQRLGARFVRTASSAVDAPRPEANGPFERALATGDLIHDAASLREILDAFAVPAR
jgi:pimeloyl-ACP methyl ester carboxylesterase